MSDLNRQTRTGEPKPWVTSARVFGSQLRRRRLWPMAIFLGLIVIAVHFRESAREKAIVQPTTDFAKRVWEKAQIRLSGSQDAACTPDTCLIVTSLCDEDDLPGVRAVLGSLAGKNPGYKIKVLAPESAIPYSRHDVRALGARLLVTNKWDKIAGVPTRNMDPAEAEAAQCRNSLSPIFEMTEYTRVLYLDSSALVRKKLDPLFEVVEDIAGVHGYGETLDPSVLSIKPSAFTGAREILAKAPARIKNKKALLHWYLHEKMPNVQSRLHLPARFNVQPEAVPNIPKTEYEAAVIFTFPGDVKPWNFFKVQSDQWRNQLNHDMFVKWMGTNRMAKDIISNTNKIGVYGAAPGRTERGAAVDEVMHPIRDTRLFRNLDRTHEYCSKLDTTYFDTRFPIQDKFSVLINFHSEDRLPHLKDIIRHYHPSPHVDRVFVTWANAELPIPKEISDVADVFLSTLDTLNARFNPPKNLQTQSVFVVDDDLLYTMEDMVQTFEAWKNRRDSQVGYYAREHNKGKNDLTEYWDDKHTYSIILTKGLFLDSRYLHAYTCLMPSEVHDYVDSVRNCEDIAMNFLVAGTSGSRPLAVHTDVDRVHDFGRKGIHTAPDGTYTKHMNSRGDCIDAFTVLLEGMPLKTNYEVSQTYYPNVWITQDWDLFEGELQTMIDRTKSLAAAALSGKSGKH